MLSMIINAMLLVSSLVAARYRLRHRVRRHKCSRWHVNSKIARRVGLLFFRIYWLQLTLEQIGLRTKHNWLQMLLFLAESNGCLSSIFLSITFFCNSRCFLSLLAVSLLLFGFSAWLSWFAMRRFAVGVGEESPLTALSHFLFGAISALLLL